MEVTQAEERWRWLAPRAKGTENEAGGSEESSCLSQGEAWHKAKTKMCLDGLSLGHPAPPTTTIVRTQSSTQAWQGSRVGWLGKMKRQARAAWCFPRSERKHGATHVVVSILPLGLLSFFYACLPLALSQCIHTVTVLTYTHTCNAERTITRRVVCEIGYSWKSL